MDRGATSRNEGDRDVIRPPVLPLREAALRATGAGRVFLGASSGEPVALLDAVAADPALWRDVTLTGAFIPGANDRAFAALGMGTAVETIFATRGLPPGGAVRHLPLHYSDYWRWLATPGRVSLAFLTLPPPRADGTVGLGLAADFAPAVIAAGARLIGIVNEGMPDVPDGPRLPLDRFEALAEGAAPLPVYDPGPPDAAAEAIAAHLVGLLRPGDTVQMGLGKVQGALLRALAGSGLRGLGYRSGMIAAGVPAALAAGVLAAPVVTGVALGSAAFYAGLADLPGIAFRPVGETHDLARLAAIAGFVSVNSALEVDLMGQVNAEWAAGRQVSGHGGLADFARGARASAGGRAVIALPATARGGAISRIVAALAPGTPVALARADAGLVVTEHGVADLTHATADDRAARLIAIAAPAHRAALADAWDALRRRGSA
jgi:acyl-CoA hydrolase